MAVDYVCGLLNSTTDRVRITAAGNPVSVQLTGTWSATVAFLASNDNVNWAGVLATPWNSATTVQTATSNCGWLISTNASVVSVTAPVFTSGTIGVFMTAGQK